MTTMPTEVLTVTVTVVHSDPDLKTLAGEATLRSAAEAGAVAAKNVENLIGQFVAPGRVCSLVITTQREDAAEDETTPA